MGKNISINSECVNKHSTQRMSQYKMSDMDKYKLRGAEKVRATLLNKYKDKPTISVKMLKTDLEEIIDQLSKDAFYIDFTGAKKYRDKGYEEDIY